MDSRCPSSFCVCWGEGGNSLFTFNPFFWSGLPWVSLIWHPYAQAPLEWLPVYPLCSHPGIGTMAEDIKTKIKNYKTAPFDSRFPNQNQTRNCWQNYLDFHRCEKAMTAKGGDVSVCEWYRRVYKSLCPVSWVSAWDDRRAEGTFPGKIWPGSTHLSPVRAPLPMQ